MAHCSMKRTCLPRASYIAFFTIRIQKKNTKEAASEKEITLSLKAAEVQQFVNASLPGVLQLGGNSTIGRGMMKRNSVSGGESL